MLAAASDLRPTLLDGHELVGEVALAYELAALLDGYLGGERGDLGELLVADLLEQRDRLQPAGIQRCDLLARGWRDSTRTIQSRVAMLARSVSVALLSRLREGRGRARRRTRAADLRAARRAPGGDRAAARQPLRGALPRGSLALAESLRGRRLGLRRPRERSCASARASCLASTAGARPVAPLRSAPHARSRATRARALRRHVAAHYDLGNEMFRLFLDETMTYSCAFFESPEMSLREAQEAKLDRVCRKLELEPGRSRRSRSAPAGGRSRCTRRGATAAA